MKLWIIILATVVFFGVFGVSSVAADPQGDAETNMANVPNVPDGGGPTDFFWKVEFGKVTTWAGWSNPSSDVHVWLWYKDGGFASVDLPLSRQWFKENHKRQVVKFRVWRDFIPGFSELEWNPKAGVGSWFQMEELGGVATVLFINNTQQTLFLTADGGQTWVEKYPNQPWMPGQYSNRGQVDIYTGYNMIQKYASVRWDHTTPTATPTSTPVPPTTTPTATSTPSSAPVITGISPLTARPGDRVTITGRNFLPRDADIRSLQVWLARQDGSGTMVKLASVVNEDGSIPANYPEWNDTFISFRVEEIRPQSGRIYVLVNNRWGRWEETFTIVNDPTPSPTPTPTSTPIPPTATSTPTMTPVPPTATPTRNTTWYEVRLSSSTVTAGGWGASIIMKRHAGSNGSQGTYWDVTAPAGISLNHCGCEELRGGFWGAGPYEDTQRSDVGVYGITPGIYTINVVMSEVSGAPYYFSQNLTIQVVAPSPTATSTPMTLWTPTPAPWPTGIALYTPTPGPYPTGVLATVTAVVTTIPRTPTPIPAWRPRPDPRPMPAVQATTPTRAARPNPLIKEIRNE